MRLALLVGTLLSLSVAGCLSDGIPIGKGDLSPSGTADLKRADLGGGTTDLAEGPPAMCLSSCNRCAGGGCCGTACCNEGEWCDSTQHCRCGLAAGCGPNLICATGGPSMLGQCGSICCGDASNPCPL